MAPDSAFSNSRRSFVRLRGRRWEISDKGGGARSSDEGASRCSINAIGLLLGRSAEAGGGYALARLTLPLPLDGGFCSGILDAVIRWRLTSMFYGVNRSVARDGKLLRW